MNAPLPKHLSKMSQPLTREEREQLLSDAKYNASRSLQATGGRVRRAFVEQVGSEGYVLTHRLEGQAARGRIVAKVEI